MTVIEFDFKGMLCKGNDRILANILTNFTMVGSNRDREDKSFDVVLFIVDIMLEYASSIVCVDQRSPLLTTQ